MKSSHNAETMYRQEERQKSSKTRASEDLPFLHIHFADLMT